MKGSIRRIIDLFDGNSKHLIIPVYQRNYDWKIKHCSRFFDDLVDIIRYDRESHFFGAIVGNPETSFDYVVIDGQQRLTTTSLLMLALVHALEGGAATSDDPELAQKIHDSYLVVSANHNAVKFKLKPVKNDNDAYSRLLREDELIESSSITVNYRYFGDRIAAQELSGDEIWEAISRLQVMALDLERQDDPQRIFESINSTGLELSEADKIRNVVLMHHRSHEQEELYEQYWNRIEKDVDYRTDWFIRFYLVSKTGKTPRRDAVYEAFRAYQLESGEGTRAILSDMRDYAAYSRALNTATTGIDRADRRLRRFNMIKHDVTLPLTMPLLGEVKAGTVGPDDFTEVVEILDAYLFRRFVCSVPTNALNKIFATLYGEIHRLRRDGDRFADVLTYSLRRRGTSGRFPTDEEFHDSFTMRDLYKIKRENRNYLFECLENNWSNDTHDIATALEDQSISIEHIMPQTLSAAWRDQLGSHADEIHATWCNRIGNLTVTGYNPSYSNAKFHDKKTRVNGFDDSPYRLNTLVKAADEWTTTQLEARTAELAGIALRYWPLPDTDFKPYVAPLPSVPMGDDESFTNEQIVSVEFGELQRTVNSWKDAFVALVGVIVDDHREAVFSYAADSNDFSVVSSGEEIPSGHSLVVAGLTVATANSTREKMTILRRLFGLLDLDTDDVLLTLRDSGSDTSEDSVAAPSGRFTELTKFQPQIDQFATLTVGKDDTRSVRAEFRTDFESAGFADTDPRSVLPSRSLPDLAAAEFTAQASPGEALAAICLLLQVDEMMPDVFHDFIADGTFGRWLTILSEADRV